MCHIRTNLTPQKVLVQHFHFYSVLSMSPGFGTLGWRCHLADGPGQLDHPCCTSFGLAILYHTGSVCFGLAQLYVAMTSALVIVTNLPPFYIASCQGSFTCKFVDRMILIIIIIIIKTIIMYKKIFTNNILLIVHRILF